MALMAVLDAAAGAAVLTTPCNTAPLTAPGLCSCGPRVMPAGLKVLGDSDVLGLADTEVGVWFIKSGAAVVVEVVPGTGWVATLATVTETALLLLPLIVKPAPAVCIDGVTAEGPALDADAAGAGHCGVP